MCRPDASVKKTTVSSSESKVEDASSVPPPRRHDGSSSSTSTSTSTSSSSRVVTVSGLLFLFLVVAGPMMISELIGGWTREYTSSLSLLSWPPRRRFFSVHDIPDMKGQVVLVTGANTGIGYQTALELARKGATVVMTARSASKGQAAMSRIKDELSSLSTNNDDETSSSSFEPDLRLLLLDLGSLASVERFVSEFQRLRLPLHCLILNAGVMKSPGADFVGHSLQYGFETTQDGLEYHIGVNHVAHAHLTLLLRDKLQASAPSRVLVVSSLAEASSYEQGMIFEDWIPTNPNEMPANYEDGKAYGQSKLANLMFAAELAQRWNGTGVTAYALHPGVIHTDLNRYMAPALDDTILSKSSNRISYHLQRLFGLWFETAFMSAPTGALTQLHLATARVETLVNGGMYHPVGRWQAKPAHPAGSNRTLQTLLWDETDRVIRRLRS